MTDIKEGVECKQILILSKILIVFYFINYRIVKNPFNHLISFDIGLQIRVLNLNLVHFGRNHTLVLINQ